MMRGSVGSGFGRHINIHYRIFTKFGVLMGPMAPHHDPDFFPKWPPDGREIGDSLYAKHFRRALLFGVLTAVLAHGSD